MTWTPKAKRHISLKHCGEQRSAMMECWTPISTRSFAIAPHMWASDGADRAVGMAATVFCPNMVFREWDECHSAVKSLPHSVEAVPEALLLDKLLVSGRDPPSLAKFVSTSDVFCKRYGHAAQQESVSFCKNSGWAMQRYTSRARPLTKSAR